MHICGAFGLKPSFPDDRLKTVLLSLKKASELEKSAKLSIMIAVVQLIGNRIETDVILCVLGLQPTEDVYRRW